MWRCGAFQIRKRSHFHAALCTPSLPGLCASWSQGAGGGKDFVSLTLDQRSGFVFSPGSLRPLAALPTPRNLLIIQAKGHFPTRSHFVKAIKGQSPSPLTHNSQPLDLPAALLPSAHAPISPDIPHTSPARSGRSPTDLTQDPGALRERSPHLSTPGPPRQRSPARPSQLAAGGTALLRAEHG